MLFEPVSKSGRAPGDADGLGARLADGAAEGAGSLARGPAAHAVSAKTTSNADAGWARLMVSMVVALLISGIEWSPESPAAPLGRRPTSRHVRAEGIGRPYGPALGSMSMESTICRSSACRSAGVPASYAASITKRVPFTSRIHS